jgi:hypothetical protein
MAANSEEGPDHHCTATNSWMPGIGTGEGSGRERQAPLEASFADRGQRYCLAGPRRCIEPQTRRRAAYCHVRDRPRWTPEPTPGGACTSRQQNGRHSGHRVHVNSGGQLPPNRSAAVFSEWRGRRGDLLRPRELRARSGSDGERSRHQTSRLAAMGVRPIGQQDRRKRWSRVPRSCQTTRRRLCG